MLHRMTSSLNVNVGLRYERIGHNGTRDRSAPAQGLGALIKSGEDQIDASYSYLNYSLAAEYLLSEKTSSFIRFSQGHKAPELDYYINNFTNQDIPPENPPAQSIRQLEIGLKHKTKDISFAGTFFASNLSDVAFSNFVFDDQTIDFSNNTIPHNPRFMANVGLTYDRGDWFAGTRYNFIGKRFGNIENAFTLPSYGTIDLDIGYALSSNFSLGLRVKNLLNSGGLANFFGPNSFGSNSDAATTAFIQANPNESFVVFPISPRAVYFSVDYRFSKR